MSTDVSTDFVHVKLGDNIRLEQYVGGELAKFIPLTPEQAAYVGDVLHKPRTITTADEANALLAESVVLGPARTGGRPVTAPRIEGRTAYVATVKDALDASFLEGVDDVVIEANAERLKMERLLKGFGS